MFWAIGAPRSACLDIQEREVREHAVFERPSFRSTRSTDEFLRHVRPKLLFSTASRIYQRASGSSTGSIGKPGSVINASNGSIVIVQRRTGRDHWTLTCLPRALTSS